MSLPAGTDTPNAKPRRRYPWRKLAILYGAVAAGQLMVVPIALYAGPRVSAGTTWIAFAIALALLASLPLAIAVLPGLGLAGTPILDRWLRGGAIRRELATGIYRALALVLVSFVVAIPMLALKVRFVSTVNTGPISRAFSPGALWIAMLSAVGAGLQEEILFRLGMLSVMVWIVARVARISGPASNHTAVLWVANLAQAYLFGLMHQALGLTGSVGGFSLVGAMVDPRTVVALVFGYGALRYGVETTAIAHTFFDASIFLVATTLPILAR